MPNLKRLLFQTTVFLLAMILLSGCQIVRSEKLGALQITTKPESSVFLDGKHIGKTPFFSDKLKTGDYEVKVVAGNASFSQKITLIEGTLAVISRDLNDNFLAQSGEILTLEKEKKGLFIISMPPESNINIDGKDEGKTPKLIENIQGGEHKITITKPNYIDREFTVKTASNYQLVANITLASVIAKDVFLKPSPPPQIRKVEIQKVASSSLLKARKESQLTSPEVGRVAVGAQYELIQETKDWVKISFDGKQGWIQKSIVKIIN